MMRRYLPTLVALTLLLNLAALAGTASAAPPALPGMDQMQAQMERGTARLKTLIGKDFEIAFMELMIPHHQSAVEMAKMVPGKATHPELVKMSQDIVSSQQHEIQQMLGWLKDWYGIANPPITPMAGMDQMMAAMQAMTGATFEQAFLEMMPMHHQGAIDMAAQAPGRATHPELLQLARTIVASQQQEIQQMREWTMSWYGFDPLPASQGAMPGLPNTGQGGGARPTARLWPLTGGLIALGVMLLVGGGLARRNRRAR